MLGITPKKMMQPSEPSKKGRHLEVVPARRKRDFSFFVLIERDEVLSHSTARLVNGGVCVLPRY